MAWCEALQSLSTYLSRPPHSLTPQPHTTKGYDRTLVPLALVGALMCAGVGASGAALLAFVAREAVYARPLSYSADVLGQR